MKSSRLGRISLSCLALFVLCLSPFALRAQVDRGSIVGTVSDSSGALVPAATVTVTDVATNQSVERTSDSAGSYVSSLLRVGTYTVTAEKQGFRKTVQSDVVVDVNQVVRVDLVLRVGTVSQTVEVAGAPGLVQSETSSLGTVESERRINDLPLNGRNFIQLAYLGPGANDGMQGSNVSGGVPENERANEALSVNGLRVANNNFLLDGVDNNEFGLGGIIVLPPPDAIGEFRTEENSMSAEFGRGGAAVNVVVKSGTNDVHGTAYEFLRNDKFDATNFFATQKPELRQNQFGFSLGGPVRQDKTFVFGDLQIIRVRKGLTFVSTVPSAAEKTGDFSDRLTGTTFSPCGATPGPGDPAFDTGAIFDPTSTSNFTCSSGTVIPLRTQFSFNGLRNVIPTGRINMVGQNVANLYPSPLPGAGLFSNFVLNGAQSNDQEHFDVRVDHRLSSKDQFFAHYSFDDVDNIRPAELGPAGGSPSDFAGTVKDRGQYSAASWTRTVSPTVLNDVHGGYFRYHVGAVPPDFGKNVAASLGITGANRGDPTSTGLTHIDVAGYQSLGDTLWFPEFVVENIFQAADTLSWIKGRHSLKFGVDFRRQQRNFFQNTAPKGWFSFDNSFTNDLTTASGGNGLAALLLGVSTFTFQDALQGEYPTRYWDLAEFVQDDFHATPDLTLNLGLRYEVDSPPNGRMGNFDLALAKVIDAVGSNAQSHAGVKFDKRDFGPRVGFAYTPFGNKQTVIRSAFGVFYSSEGDIFDDQGLNPPFLAVNSRTFAAGSVPTPGQFQFISEGFGPITFPDPNNPAGTVRATGPKRIIPRVMEWNFAIQRELASNLVLQTAYVGTRGVHLWNHESTNLNQPPLPLDSNFSDSTGNFGRPYFSRLPNLNTILPLDFPQLDLAYHSLQVSLNKRFSQGFNFLAAYTFAHNVGTADGNVASRIQNPFKIGVEKGPVDPDYRHRFTISYLWDLPVGRGRRYLSYGSRLVNGLVGGWEFAGITLLRSGGVFTPTLGTDSTNTGTGGFGGARPNVYGNPYNFSTNTGLQSSLGCSSPGHQTLDCFYNQAAFYDSNGKVAPPLAPGQSVAHAFGNAGRNILRGPDQRNFDFSVFKDFQVNERHTVQFRAELFNIMNTPQFALPGGNPDVPGGAAITSTINANRQIQFALKWSF